MDVEGWMWRGESVKELQGVLRGDLGALGSFESWKFSGQLEVLVHFWVLKVFRFF